MDAMVIKQLSTIQIIGYGYGKYVEGVVEVAREKMEFAKYEKWTPYGWSRRKD
jgi:hypothetical protein